MPVTGSRSVGGHSIISTVSQKQVPTFKLSVTMSNLDRFSEFCTAGKTVKFATTPTQHYPPHLRHVAALPWDIKNSSFLQIFSRYGKMQTHCILSPAILILLRT